MGIKTKSAGLTTLLQKNPLQTLKEERNFQVIQECKQFNGLDKRLVTFLEVDQKQVANLQKALGASYEGQKRTDRYTGVLSFNNFEQTHCRGQILIICSLHQ